MTPFIVGQLDGAALSSQAVHFDALDPPFHTVWILHGDVIDR
jgi:hypothetical protein